MEQAKKVILLPQESVDQLRSAFLNDGLKSVQTLGTTMSRLEAEMNDILNLPYTNVREKWKKYQQILQRYLLLRELYGEKKRHTDTITESTKVLQDYDPSDDDVDEDEEKRKEEEKQDTEVIESVPKKFRQKAALFKRRFRATGYFEWNNEHTVIIGGVRIPQSNIVDLVSDALRNRKKSIPVGRDPFEVALRMANIPQECVGNAQNPRYNVGDLVRISKTRSVFAKDYESGWTLELFRILRISCIQQPPVYFLRDLADKDIDSFFYEGELSKVRKELNESFFEVDKILKSQGKGRSKEFFVSWKGYPKKFNSWVKGYYLKDIK
ncbi:uncharacterized protein LOC111643254 [Copidosoma floridanum]|uniref:uncharacterized protein LOC111643254 n=1 Tax=Copidosoma floridanum TaxID=29053 RepID=UPI000C6F93F3|nr:uncharacterized protein LOC111643254 [Copidosoma floridanum]